MFLLLTQANVPASFLNVNRTHVWEAHGAVCIILNSCKDFMWKATHPYSVGQVHTHTVCSAHLHIMRDVDIVSFFHWGVSKAEGHVRLSLTQRTCFSQCFSWVTARALRPHGETQMSVFIVLGAGQASSHLSYETNFDQTWINLSYKWSQLQIKFKVLFK